MRTPKRLFLAISLVLATAPAFATRPTPHQRLDEALRPVQEQLEQVHATDAERHDVEDLMGRAESLAADLVEARQHNLPERAQRLEHRMELLARVVRGRIEAQRAEAQAATREAAALDADTRRVQARAALERAAERRLDAERSAGSSAAPSASPSPAPSGPATAPAGGAR
jgi:hypothetical protein